jgi:hypothetical protein
VRRILCFLSSASLVFILLALSGCYSGTRPPRIGSAAPDFTVRDAERTVTLSQLQGAGGGAEFLGDVVSSVHRGNAVAGADAAAYEGQGVTVLAVSVDVDEDNYQRFLKITT